MHKLTKEQEDRLRFQVMKMFKDADLPSMTPFEQADFLGFAAYLAIGTMRTVTGDEYVRGILKQVTEDLDSPVVVYAKTHRESSH